MFKQEIKDGYQIEVPDNWLKDGNPFEIKRDEYRYEVKFGGYVRSYRDEKTGRDMFVQEDYRSVIAVPYDLPVVGYGNNTVNTLRIWDAEPVNTFNLNSFDKGDYQKAIEEENLAKNIVEVLYPNDNHYAGKELRLKQQYFFVSASVQRAVDQYKKHHDDCRKLYEKVTFQLNDTHPTVAVAELMRILMDEEGLEWDEAWDVTTKTVAYTNHTIMSEALEKWPLELFSRLLPRIYQIVEEINRRFVEEIKAAMPELPADKCRRYIDELAIPEKDAQLLTKYRKISEYFDKACEGVKSPKTVSNFIIGQIFRRTETEADKEIFDVAVTPEQLNELVKLLDSGKIRNNLAKATLEKMLDSGKGALEFISESDMGGLDENALNDLCKQAVEGNPKAVEDYKNGKEKAIKSLVGNVMKNSRGKADPALAESKIKELIG